MFLTTFAPAQWKKIIKVNSKPIPIEVQEHTATTLQKMVKPPQKRSSSPSFSQATTSTLSSHSDTTNRPSFTTSSPSISESERCFQDIEKNLDQSTNRMDSIENLCHQLKGSTDMISHQLVQLTSDLNSRAQLNPGSPASKIAKFS
jgi:small-conductance mechanosensitive channel